MAEIAEFIHQNHQTDSKIPNQLLLSTHTLCNPPRDPKHSIRSPHLSRCCPKGCLANTPQHPKGPKRPRQAFQPQPSSRCWNSWLPLLSFHKPFTRPKARFVGLSSHRSKLFLHMCLYIYIIIYLQYDRI